MTSDPQPPQSPLAQRVQGALSSHFQAGSEQIPPLVDRLLAEAQAAQASDVHLASRRDQFEAHFRVDGDLLPVAQIPNAQRDPIIQRLKVMARLVVYQTREPQDGRIDTEIDGRRLSLRASFLPTLHGERVVLRFPDPARGHLTLEELGMGAEMLARLQRHLSRPQGAVLLTGPASSGKTTTIYAALRWLVAQRGRELNIMSLEDPIEAEVEGVSQTQIDRGVQFDFPQALRAALRQDPNVLVVGEIRDAVTAKTAIQAALAGHLLIATLHAGSAPGVFTRLAQMDVERYLIATAVTGVLNQRLARRVCPHCGQPTEMDPQTLSALKLSPEGVDRWTLRGGVGCPQCNGTGCRGRLGVFELLEVTQPVHEALLAEARESDVARLATEDGQPSLRDDLLAKMGEGVIPPREALRLLD